VTKADPTGKVDEVSFEEPNFKIQYDWRAIAAQLRTRPMEWAKIFAADRVSVVNAIRLGQVEPVRPSLGFEVKTTNNKRGIPRTCDLWMRYNPDKVDSMSAVVIAAKKKREK
jgi:hypothetical protein